MVYLKRTKQSYIKLLEDKAPRNITEVYNILNRSVDDCLARLQVVEEQFYGKGVTPLEEVRKWVSPIYSIILASGVSVVTSKSQVDDILRTVGSQSKKAKADVSAMNKMHEACRKVLERCPYSFKDILVDMYSLATHLDRYCSSFYDINEPGFDTVKDYEEKRNSWKKEIHRSLGMLKSLPLKFKGDGIIMADLGNFGKELAAKAEAFKVAFLFIFPQSCDNIRQTCKIMKEWIQTDRSYPQYVMYDVVEMDEKKREYTRAIAEIQRRCFTLAYRSEVPNPFKVFS